LTESKSEFRVKNCDSAGLYISFDNSEEKEI